MVNLSDIHTRAVDPRQCHYGLGDFMIVLGIVLLLIGFLAGIPILTTLGIILVVIGAVLFLLGSTGRPVGGRAHYW
jgi:hypothetical protein